MLMLIPGSMHPLAKNYWRASILSKVHFFLMQPTVACLLMAAFGKSHASTAAWSAICVGQFTGAIPSSAFLGVAVTAAGFSLVCQVTGRGKWGNFIARGFPLGFSSVCITRW